MFFCFILSSFFSLCFSAILTTEFFITNTEWNQSCLQAHPFIQDYGSLYASIKTVAKGQDAQVYCCIRDNVKMACRFASCATQQQEASLLNTLRNMTHGMHVGKFIPFYPKLLGAYKTKSNVGYHGKVDAYVQEMEFADLGTLDKKFKHINNMMYEFQKKIQLPVMSDYIVFEFALGEWAGAYFGDLSIVDNKDENFGLKIMAQPRKYVIEGRVFEIHSSCMIMRLDVGGTGRHSLLCNNQNILERFTCTLSCRAGYELSAAAKSFIRNLSSGVQGKSVIDIFADFYAVMDKEEVMQSEALLYEWPILDGRAERINP